MVPAVEERGHGGPSSLGPAESYPASNPPTARNRHPNSSCNKAEEAASIAGERKMHDIEEIAPLLSKREGGSDQAGTDLGKNWLGARNGGNAVAGGGERRGRQRPRRWRSNAGIAGVVMFSLAFLGLVAIFKTIQSERTPASSTSTLQEMAQAGTSLGSAGGSDPRAQDQWGESSYQGASACFAVRCVFRV